MQNRDDSVFIDYYELLNIAPTADVGQIRRAFLLQAKQLHPDAGGSTVKMQRLNEAYKTLMSPTAKPVYDRSHNFHTNQTALRDYSYQDSNAVVTSNTQADADIDAFLDNLLQEYRNGIPKQKQSIKDRLKQLFSI